MLKERKCIGGEQFSSISERGMLQFTLPLQETEGQTIVHGTELKTIQLFILEPQDFHTAVNYLSHNAGMRHCHLKNVSANLMDANAPRNAHSQPRESSGTSTMGPPVGRPMRPRNQPVSQWPAATKIIPGQFSQRKQTAMPNSTFVNGDPSQHPPPQKHRYRPSPSPGPQNARAFFIRDGSSHTQWLPSRGPGAGAVGDRMPLDGHPVRRASMASHSPSPRPMQHNGQEPSPSNHQVKTRTDHVPNGAFHDRFDGQPADQAGQAWSSGRRTVGMKEHSSSRLPPERPASRPSSISERGVPVSIQVLEPPDESSYSEFRAKIRWEFTLHLLPSTKILELCLYAASYIRREYCYIVDGSALAAQSKNGIVFEDQDSLSKEMLQGEPLILIERRRVATTQPVPANFDRSSIDPLQLDSTSHADNFPRSERRPISQVQSFPANFERSSVDPLALDWTSQDEADQVPLPCQLPFPLVGAPVPPRSSSPTAATQLPPSQRPDLMNTSIRTGASEQLEQPISQNISRKAATKKQPGSRQKRAPCAPKRPASSAGGSILDLMSATTQPSEPRTLPKRPKTSQGIRRKRKALSSDEAVSPAEPSVPESVPSRAEVSKQEMAKTACMGCRRKKRKCNRLKPACGQCLKDSMQCTYPNIQETTEAGSIADKTYKGHGVEIVDHPMALRSQAVTSLPVMSDASTQTSHSREYRDIATQTQAAEPDKIKVGMKDVGTDPCNLYADASMETEGCDDIWLPFSQAAEAVVWACKRSEEHRSKPAEIFKITDPSHEDYRSQVEQAAVYAAKFEKKLREKCEQVLKSDSEELPPAAVRGVKIQGLV